MNYLNYLYPIVSSLMFALYPIFMKNVGENGIGMYTINFYFAIISLIAMFIASIVKNKGCSQFKINKKEFLLTVVNTGIIGCYLVNYSITTSFKYIDASLIQVIKSTYPFIVLVIEVLLFKRKANKKDLVDSFLIIFGLILTLGKIGPQNSLLCGVLWSFLSALAISVYSMVLAKIPSQLDDFTFWFYTYLGLTITFFLSYLLSNEGDIIKVMYNGKILFYMIWTSLLTYTFSTILYVIGIRKVGIVKNCMLGVLTIIFAILIDVIFYDVKINVLQVIGVLLIILSSFTDLLFNKANK